MNSFYPNKSVWLSFNESFFSKKTINLKTKVIIAIATWALSTLASCFYFGFVKRWGHKTTQSNHTLEVSPQMIQIKNQISLNSEEPLNKAVEAKTVAEDQNLNSTGDTKKDHEIILVEKKNLTDEFAHVKALLIDQSNYLLNELQIPLSKVFFNNCHSEEDFNTLETNFSILAACQAEAKTDVDLDVYYSLVQDLSFESVAQFSASVQAVYDLFPYRSLVNRVVNVSGFKNLASVNPSIKKLKDLRATNLQEWQSLLKARSNLSSTAANNSNVYQNWLKAEALVAKKAEECLPITSEWIEEIHGFYTKGLVNCEGFPLSKYRTPEIQSWVSDTKRHYIHGKYVKSEMAAFISWLNKRFELHDEEQNKTGELNAGYMPQIVQTAAKAYQWLVSIHPFPDGNGRTSRLVMDCILERYGILPPKLSTSNVAVYGDDHYNVPQNHAFSVVWNGIQESYKICKYNL